MMSADFSLGSPPLNARSGSRPPSRTRSNHPDEAQQADHYDYTLRQGLSSLPMPRGSDSDSDSDDGNDNADMVLDRSAASSTVSMMPHERVEALQRVNDDLARKLQDTERTMQRKLAEQEAEFDDLQVKLEETRNELSAAKREEKELRSKEVCSVSFFPYISLIRFAAPKQHPDRCARGRGRQGDQATRDLQGIVQ